MLITQYNDFSAVCIGCKDSNAVNYIQIQGGNGYLFADSAACVVRKGKICLNGKDEETFSLQDKQLTHYYYLQRFKQIMENKDYVTCYLELDKTLHIMKVLDEVRKSAGICLEGNKWGDMSET